MKQRSLARRSIALVLIVEVVCAVAFSVASLIHERNVRWRAMDTVLYGRSDSLMGAVQDAEDPEANVELDPEELRLPPQDAWAVYAESGRLLGRAGDPSGEITQRRGPGTRNVRRGHGYRVYERQALRIIDRAETKGVGLRRPVTIVYATPIGPMMHEIREAAEFYTAISLLLMLATAAVLVISLRRLLRPLDELAARASGVGTRSDTFTPPQSALEVRELRPLAQALSSTIGRLRDALEMEHRFVSDAAHELKTAVAVVRSSLQLLTLRERTPAEYASGLARMLEDNQRVEQLVARMLTLGRFEEQPSDTGTTDLNESVAVTAERLAAWSQSRGVRIEQLSGGSVFVALTSEAAETLVSNLLTNAVQHSHPGASVRVSIHEAGPESQDSGSQDVLLTVKDTGTGIPPESLPHVFERFYRDDRSRSRQTGGAGLGLAICKSIVEGAGGSISVQSLVGEGTTMTVRLRAVPVPAPSHAASSESTLQV